MSSAAKRNEAKIEHWAGKMRQSKYQATGDDRIDSAIGLVYRSAQKMVTSKAARANQFDDLIQEGMLALHRAAQIYDPSNTAGASFATYAYRSIANRMKRWMITDKTVRGTKNPPDQSRPGGAFAPIVISVDQFAKRLKTNNNDEGDTTEAAWAILCGGKNDQGQEEEIHKRQSWEIMQNVLRSWLDNDERMTEIVIRRNGLDPNSGVCEQFQPIAESLGITKQRVDQLHRVAMSMIRRAAVPELTKTCLRCGETKMLTMFGADTRNKDGRKAQCKPCAHQYNKEREKIRCGTFQSA